MSWLKSDLYASITSDDTSLFSTETPLAFTLRSLQSIYLFLAKGKSSTEWKLN